MIDNGLLWHVQPKHKKDFKKEWNGLSKQFKINELLKYEIINRSSCTFQKIHKY